MSAAGKVCTGFSLPYVAKYANSGTTITYSDGRRLARGVDVAINPNTTDTDPFHADNVAAESKPSRFADGTVDLTVDGLLIEAEKMIMGLPTATSVTVGSDTVDVYEYGDSMPPPYVGLGFIARYQSDGVVSYVPIVLPKCRFQTFSTEAATQEEDIDWQTQALTADILRDDSSDRHWKRVAEDQDTEAEAEAWYESKLGPKRTAAPKTYSDWGECGGGG